jgi:oligoribonuclease
MSDTDYLVWVDTETFGLYPDRDPIIEVGLCVTDLDLEIIEGINQIKVWSGLHEGRLAAARRSSYVGDDWVVKTHTQNMLLSEAVTDGVPMHEAEEFLIDSLPEQYKGLPLCGSTIDFDRNMLRAQMPNLEKLFHYRSINISSLKELCKRYNPPVYKKLSWFVDKQEKHRVEPDLHDTLAEANYYIDEFLHVSI